MNELSLYILDLAQNSVTAKAKNIRITVQILTGEDRIIVVIQDDGCGMDEELLKRVTSPFATTRTTRKVGLGIPMIQQLCEMCEGTFSIESKKGEGTKLTLTFKRSHVDLPPMGNLAETMLSLINGSPVGIDFFFQYSVDDRSFEFSTPEIRAALGEDVGLNTPDVLIWMREAIQEGVEETGHSHE